MVSVKKTKLPPLNCIFGCFSLIKQQFRNASGLGSGGFSVFCFLMRQRP